MLNQKENRVMSVIAVEAKDKNSVLLSSMDIKTLSGDKELKTSTIDKIVNDLCTDGYYDLVLSERRGERVYCITLTEKGKGFLRTKKLMKRNLIYRLALSALLALFSFIIGLILRAIF